MLALGIFLASFFVSYVGTLLLLKVRLDKSFVDVPNARSSHEVAKPRFGGIAIVGSFVLTFAILLLSDVGAERLLPLLVGGLIVFAAGVLDDWRALPVSWRFAAQGLAIVVVVASGNVVSHIQLPLVGNLELGVAAIPFTVLFLLTSINFYNFIDGIDGLAAGSAFITAAFLALIAYMLGHGALALVCLAVAGSAAGFLQFNFPPARLFMGDSGSTFLGFFFAYVAIAGNGLRPEIPFFIPILILSSLYLDAGLTLARRALRGEKIFQPHHTHYYQRLLSLGLNHKQVTVLEYGLIVLLGTSALIFIRAGGFFPYFITLCWVVVFTALILKIRGRERGDRLFWERRSLLVIGGDLLLIAVAYFGAYFIRMNFRFTDPEGIAVLKAFPFVLVVRSACFYWYGLYRGVWKYTSTPDVLRIVKAVTTGSAIIVTLLVLFYRFVSFPRSLFVIEYVLLIIALGGTRFASRLFHEFGKEASGSGVRRVGIIGAGDYGERVGREIRNAGAGALSVACYIDDDMDKVGLVLQGVPIVGPVDNLGDICRRFDLQTLVLGATGLSDDKLKKIVREAREAGVPLESRPSGYVHRATPAIVELDRIARDLDRGLPVQPAESTTAFFAGKRVLITHGGEEIGVPLVNEIVRCGGRVTMQVESPGAADRFHDVQGSSCDIYIGSIERENDAARALEAARPQVIFHCTSLRPRPVVNQEEYLWRRIVRTTGALCKTLPKHPIASLTLVNLWDHARPGDYAASAAAISEILVLNSADVLPLAPRVVRLPSVLTTAALQAIMNPPREESLETASFSLLEAEALAMSLDATAKYSGRVMLIPGAESSVTARDIRGQAARVDGRPGVAHRVRQRSSVRSALVFPCEQAKASIVTGAKEVVSPVYPASADLFEIARVSTLLTDADLIAEQLHKLHSVLVGRAPGAIRSSTE